MYKRCTTCYQEKPMEEFHNNRSKRDGKESRCKTCNNEAKNKYYKNNREKSIASVLDWKSNNKELVKGYAKTYREKTSEKSKEYQTQYYLLNKERIDKRNKEYYILNTIRHKAKCAARRYMERKAQPLWLTDDMWSSIYDMYKEAERLTRVTGVQHHVDHIIPIKSDLVCGLHVPWNLRVLTETENKQSQIRYPQRYYFFSVTIVPLSLYLITCTSRNR